MSNPAVAGIYYQGVYAALRRLTGYAGRDEETVRGIPGRTYQGQGARQGEDCAGIGTTNGHEWNFEKLVGMIRHVHEELAAQAGKAVNISLTFRNRLFGCYIAEYELNGLKPVEQVHRKKPGN